MSTHDHSPDFFTALAEALSRELVPEIRREVERALEGHREPKALSVPQAAERLGVSQTTVRRLVERGAITFRQVGRRITFTAEDIAAYLESAAS